MQTQGTRASHAMGRPEKLGAGPAPAWPCTICTPRSRAPRHARGRCASPYVCGCLRCCCKYSRGVAEEAVLKNVKLYAAAAAVAPGVVVAAAMSWCSCRCCSCAAIVAVLPPPRRPPHAPPGPAAFPPPARLPGLPRPPSPRDPPRPGPASRARVAAAGRSRGVLASARIS